MIKKRNLILLRILDQIQQDKKDARDGIEKSIATICNEEGILRLNKYSKVYFLMLYLLSSFIFRVENSF